MCFLGKIFKKVKKPKIKLNNGSLAYTTLKNSLNIRIFGCLEKKDYNMKGIKLQLRRNINQIILHCSDTDNKETTIYDINEWHKKRGWAGCGYHYFIQSDGKLYRGRPETWVGSHVKNHNTNSLGICINGKRSFYQEQTDTLNFLLINIIGRLETEKLKHSKYPNSLEEITFILKCMKIVGHNHYNKYKTCPNFNVYTYLNNLKIIPNIA